MSFASLKKNRNNFFEKAKEEAKKQTSKSFDKEEDNRFWSPTVDKAGNGFFVIRFLPAADGDDMPWLRTFKHAFQQGSTWFIENCLTTIGQDCPVCTANSELWNTGSKANQEIVRKRKRKLTYISNILVVKDPTNPDNDGKVFLFKYGKKIFDKLNSLMHPEFEDETAINPFDAWEGANLKLKIRMVEGYRNFDKSEFDVQSAIADSDEDIEAIWKREHSLAEFTDPKNFKSASALQERLNKVLSGGSGLSQNHNEDADDDMPRKASSAPAKPQKTAEAPKLAKVADEDDETMAFLKGLAKDDLDDEIPF